MSLLYGSKLISANGNFRIAQRRSCSEVLSCDVNFDLIPNSAENADPQSHVDGNNNNTWTA